MASFSLNSSRVCRLCLSTDTQIDIFDESRIISSVPLQEKILTCLPVKLVFGENLPTKICESCLELVDRFHEFWLLAKSTQLKLNDLLSSVTPKTDNNLKAAEATSVTPYEAGLDEYRDNRPSSVDNNCSNPRIRHSYKNQGDTKTKICVDCGVHKSDANFELGHSNQTPCDICNQIELPKNTESSQRRQYECSICDYKNNSLSNFKIHMMKHNGEYLATCQYCGKGFYSKSACEEHQLSKHSNRISMNHCAECNANFNSKAYLRQHMKTHASNFRKDNFQCELCGKTYTSGKGIKRHKMIHHQGQVYQCGICDKEVKSLESLNNHRKIHVGEKSFVCATCGKFFRTRNGLSVHERIHTGSKPFKCHICDRMFSQSSSLKVHLRYHYGERPYGCKECSKKYVTATLLKKHQKSHNQVEEKDGNG